MSASGTHPTDRRMDRRSDDVYHRILSMIFDEALSPGLRIPAERELSERLGVSRTTVRDALNRLEASGFIARRPKSGTYVCSAIPRSVRASLEDVVDAELIRFRDVLEVRRVLELWSVGRAAENPGRGDIVELESCVETMREAAILETPEQVERFGHADLRFHQILAEMTGNPLYVHLFDLLFSLVLRSIALSRQLVPGDYAQQNVAVHRRIYEAVADGDRESARHAMEQHFDFVERHLRPNKVAVDPA